MYHHHFVHHTPHMDWTGIELGPLCWETSDCQSHDIAKLWSLGLFNQGLTVKVNTETSAVLCGNALSVSEHCVCGNLAAEEMDAKWRQRLWAWTCVIYCMIVSATGTDCRKLPNEDHHNLYSSANMIQAIKSQRWDGQEVSHVLGEEKCTQGFDLKERDSLGDLGIDGRRMLKWNFKK